MIQTASLEITPEMLVLDAGIDEFKGAWRALGTLAPERLAALRGSPPSITVTVYQIQQLRVAFNAHPHSVHLVNCHRNLTARSWSRRHRAAIRRSSVPNMRSLTSGASSHMTSAARVSVSVAEMPAPPRKIR